MNEPPKNNSEKKGFKYWYINVFKYHYSKLAIIFALAAAVVVFNIVDSVNTKKEYDLNIVIATEGAISEASTAELKQLAEETVGDINQDGEININIQIVNLGDNSIESQNRLMLLMSLPENVVFFMDEHYSAISAEYFNDLNDYGITSDDEIRQRVYVGDTRIMNGIDENIEFYACLADWTTDGKGDALWTQAGVKLIKEILNSR